MTAISPITVTVMIPTYNQAAYIKQAVQSALSQDYSYIEVIVSDDCSTDMTETIVRAIDDERLKYIRNKRNLGRTENYRNILFNHATGDYVVNLDGDDYFTDNSFISDAVKLIDEYRDTVIVTGKVRVKTPNKSFCTTLPEGKQLLGVELLSEMPKSEYHFMHMATVYAKSLAIELDFYRFDLISSDWESLYRLCLRGTVQYLDREIGVWRIHGENATIKANYASIFENLSIWGYVYNEAVKFGFSRLQAKVTCAKCIAFFAQHNFSPISKIGNLELVKFVVLLFKTYTLAGLIISVNPKYLAKLIASFFGYYRRNNKI